MLAGLVLAASCAAWHPAVVGHYPGTVVSSGQEQPVDTWIELTPDGRLQGRYVLHEPTRDVPGTLAPVGDEGCNAALFQWTDLYGSGVTRLRFHPEAKCFDGSWGVVATNPTLFWHACTQDRVTS